MDCLELELKHTPVGHLDVGPVQCRVLSEPWATSPDKTRDLVLYLKLVIDSELWRKKISECSPCLSFPRDCILAFYSFLEYSCKHLAGCCKHYETAAQSPVAETHGDMEMEENIKTTLRL